MQNKEQYQQKVKSCKAATIDYNLSVDIDSFCHNHKLKRKLKHCCLVNRGFNFIEDVKLKKTLSIYILELIYIRGICNLFNMSVTIKQIS